MPVWDRFVRLFHWTIAVLVPVTYWLLEGGEAWHAYAGYVIAALVAARIVWGFIGTRHARFADFFPTPARLRHHLAQFPRDDSTGHNPLGGAMILLLLALLALTALTGWMQETDRWWGEEWVQVLHARAADALLVAAGVHVLAVLVMQRLTGRRLIRAMLTGRR